MTETSKNFFGWALKVLARLTISRYRPGIIGVTGSVGKTSAKLAIASVLSTQKKVRSSQDNFNNKMALPLAILGPWEKISGMFFWPKVFLASVYRLVIKSDYPEILVLEYAVERPGDMAYFLGIAEPNVSVVTAISDIPAHVEFFESPEDLAEEKGKLVEALPAGGVAILNFDDDTVIKMKERTKAQVMTFGFEKGADIQIVNFKNRTEEDRPAGIVFRFEYMSQPLHIQMPGALGKTQAYAAAAAASAGLIFGINFINISEALEHYEPALHCMHLYPGLRGSRVIDDSCNASPVSMQSALQTLKDLPGRRKIAVLGDMLEIGRYTIPAHQKIGHLAAKFADILIVIGPRAKFIGEGALEAGFPRKDLYELDSWEDAKKTVEGTVRKEDLVLVKASGAMRLDNIVELLRSDEILLAEAPV